MTKRFLSTLMDNSISPQLNHYRKKYIYLNAYKTGFGFLVTVFLYLDLCSFNI